MEMSVTVSIPILMYHEITPRPLASFRKYSVTPEELSRHVGWLQREGYTTVDLDAVHAVLRGERDLPARAIAITFDDGFRDCLEHAVPVLATQGFTATFYIVAGLVGATSRWLPAERGFELPIADWPMLRAAEAARRTTLGYVSTRALRCGTGRSRRSVANRSFLQRLVTASASIARGEYSRRGW